MFGLSNDALTTGVVSPNCVDCDSAEISQYITTVNEKTYGNLISEGGEGTDDQNISGSSFDGTILTIGIEDGQSETVDLSSLEDGTGITADQASAITANTAKTGITSDQAAAIIANTAKTGITRTSRCYYSQHCEDRYYRSSRCYYSQHCQDRYYLGSSRCYYSQHCEDGYHRIKPLLL